MLPKNDHSAIFKWISFVAAGDHDGDGGFAVVGNHFDSSFCELAEIIHR